MGMGMGMGITLFPSSQSCCEMLMRNVQKKSRGLGDDGNGTMAFVVRES